MAVTRLIEPEMLKQVLGITFTDAEDDARLFMACDAATSMIQAHCDRQFIADTTATARVFVASTPWTCHVDDISTTTDLVIKTDEDDDGVISRAEWQRGFDDLDDAESQILAGAEQRFDMDEGLRCLVARPRLENRRGGVCHEEAVNFLG